MMPELNWTEAEIYLLAARGYAFYRQGLYNEAGIIFNGLTVLDPLNSYCRSALAAVCLAVGDVSRAVSELTFLLNQNPADHDARARRGEAYCMQQHWDHARSDLEILRRNGQTQLAGRLALRLEVAGTPA
jgi:tetratricopeptide (TPR) repeat protein